MDYPEALVEKVANAIEPVAWKPDGFAYHRAYARERAVAVLDALGLREEWAYMVDGKFMFGPFDEPPYKAGDLHSGSRYVTDWEAKRD